MESIDDWSSFELEIEEKNWADPHCDCQWSQRESNWDGDWIEGQCWADPDGNCLFKGDFFFFGCIIIF